MTMTPLFPPSKRVGYQHAPLLQVVCQVRFPTVLKIESEPPVQFQDAIRSHFPLLERSQVVGPQQVPPEVLQALGGFVGGGGWIFLTEDRAQWITLCNDFMSLTVTNYQRWEAFTDRLKRPLLALAAVYQPAFLSRTGLRYIDLIQRSKLNLTDVPWSRLLRPEILGELGLPVLEAHAIDVRKQVRIALPSIGGTLLIQHGFGQAIGSSEQGYMIDLDFSSDRKTGVNDVGSLLDDLHKGVGEAFRWCIADELHNALGPIPMA